MELTGVMKNRFFAAYALFTVLVLFGCDSNKTDKNQTKTVTKPFVQGPSISGDSAFAFVKAQVDFGPRVPNTTAHSKCADFLVRKFKSYGWEVKEQFFTSKTFDGKQLNLRNIIASFNPTTAKRVVLASHWDSRPFADQDTTDKEKPIDGANDGASGVGVLLEIARTVTQATQKPGIGIDIVLFDGEDYGPPSGTESPIEDPWCLGSQYWAKNPHVASYKAYYGILLDMVGAKNANFSMEGSSMHYAPNIMQKVWETGHKLGYGHFFSYSRTSGITDDHVYVNEIAKIPMIDIIHHDPNGSRYFGWYWHTHEDNIKAVDPTTLKAVGQTILTTLYNE